MAFQFSHEFHRNWLAAPLGTRQQIKADLSSIVELLKPETALGAWQKKHGINRKSTAKAEQVSLFESDSLGDEPQHLQASSGEEMSDFIRQVRAGSSIDKSDIDKSDIDKSGNHSNGGRAESAVTGIAGNTATKSIAAKAKQSHPQQFSDTVVLTAVGGDFVIQNDANTTHNLADHDSTIEVNESQLVAYLDDKLDASWRTLKPKLRQDMLEWLYQTAKSQRTP